MSNSTSPESHILLTKPEFAEAFHNAGFDRSWGNRIFGAIYKEGFYPPNTGYYPRTASTLMYDVENRKGENEIVISITNLAKVGPQIETFHQIGDMSVEAIFEVMESLLLTKGEQAPVPTE